MSTMSVVREIWHSQAQLVPIRPCHNRTVRQRSLQGLLKRMATRIIATARDVLQDAGAKTSGLPCKARHSKPRTSGD